MSTTARLRAYNRAVQGWITGKLDADDIDLLVRTRWITKEQGEEIKLLLRGDQRAADQLIERYRIELT